VGGTNFRAAVADVQKLADELGQLPGFRAEVVESPLDVRPTLALQGRLDAREPDTMQTRFVVRIVRDRSPPA